MRFRPHYLFAMVRRGHFREDLYYRLRAFMIRTPPLKAHPQDIPALAQALWKSVTKDPAGELSSDVIHALTVRGWPGNVRELRTTLSSVANLFGTKDIRDVHVRAALEFESTVVGSDTRASDVESLQAHRLHCLRHLRQTDEVLRATQVAVRECLRDEHPSSEALQAVASATHDRVNELAVLCAHPVLFHGEATYALVHRVKEHLQHFVDSISTNSEGAVVYWREELEGEFAALLSALFAEVDRVVGGG